MSEQQTTAAQVARLRSEASRFRRMHDTAVQPWVADAGWVADDLAAAADTVERLQAALTRLRDCDWVVTPHDRMDAVRAIARAALNGEAGRPYD